MKNTINSYGNFLHIKAHIIGDFFGGDEEEHKIAVKFNHGTKLSVDVVFKDKKYIIKMVVKNESLLIEDYTDFKFGEHNAEAVDLFFSVY